MEKERILPVFPLPDVVLFPGTRKSLHVFEPRYRAMIRDVVGGEETVVVALMSGDGFRSLGTIGRIEDLELLEDGRFNLTVDGSERVAISEVPSDKPYRLVRVKRRPERLGTFDARALAEARLELLGSYGILRSMASRNEPFALHPDLPFEVVVNTACACLPIDASLRQRLLAEDSLMERQRLGLEYLSSAIEAMTWLRATGSVADSLAN